MSFETSRVSGLMREALNFRAKRQDIIASNIANVDTPFYKARNIDFKGVLEAKEKQIFDKRDNDKLQMATTQDAKLDITKPAGISHIRAKIVISQAPAGNDGNNVNIDKQTTQLSQNSIGYNAIVAAIKKNQQIYTSVIDASAKLS